MHSELWNLYLFALAIGKAAGMTELGVGIAFAVLLERNERWIVWLRKQ
jgi:hypothetical protein